MPCGTARYVAGPQDRSFGLRPAADTQQCRLYTNMPIGGPTRNLVTERSDSQREVDDYGDPHEWSVKPPNSHDRSPLWVQSLQIKTLRLYSGSSAEAIEMRGPPRELISVQGIECPSSRQHPRTARVPPIRVRCVGGDTATRIWWLPPRIWRVRRTSSTAHRTVGSSNVLISSGLWNAACGGIHFAIRPSQQIAATSP